MRLFVSVFSVVIIVFACNTSRALLHLPPSVASKVNSAELTGSSDYAPGWGPGSWRANIPAGNNYAHYYPVWNSLASGTTINDIDYLSYWTKDSNVSDAKDWYLAIYTKPITEGWYENLITAEVGYLSQSITGDTDDQWQQWKTGTGDDYEMKFTTINRKYSSSWKTLADIKNTYGSEEILAINLKAGDTGVGWDYSGGLDGFEAVFASNSNQADIKHNMVTPEPTTIALAFIGVPIIGGIVRCFRRRKK